MQCEQRQWRPGEPAPGVALGDATLVMAFGDNAMLADADILRGITRAYPDAVISGCTTAGEIVGRRVLADSVCTTAVRLERTRVADHGEAITKRTSRAAGRKLGEALAADDLRHVFVLSEGIAINGSELVRGLEQALPAGTSITGGLSGDGERFVETGVLWRGQLKRSFVVCLGFYGDNLVVGCGTVGGWDAFGPERTVTRSDGSVLYELDGRPALELYKKYLGEFADGLPATGLLFPLSLRERPGGTGRVRTILGVDEDVGSLIFAGDLPTGAFVRLMMASVDRLVDGAAEAARSALVGDAKPTLALLVSCVGRKLVLRQRIEEELEAVGDILEGATLAGFYSYGEIAPHQGTTRCELHNQTMTITTLSET